MFMFSTRISSVKGDADTFDNFSINYTFMIIIMMYKRAWYGSLGKCVKLIVLVFVSIFVLEMS